MKRRTHDGEDRPAPRRRPDGCPLCHHGWLYHYAMNPPYTMAQASASIITSIPCTCGDGEAIRASLLDGVTRLWINGRPTPLSELQATAQTQSRVMNAEAVELDREMQDEWRKDPSGPPPLLLMLTKILQRAATLPGTQAQALRQFKAVEVGQDEPF